MQIDHETQAFLDLYMKRGSKTYTPPETVAREGDTVSIYRQMQEIAAQEAEMLNEIWAIRFSG